MASPNKMSRSKLFEKLGAPLRNFRWSWGAVSESGDAYLAVWTDQFRRIKEKIVLGIFRKFDSNHFIIIFTFGMFTLRTK